MEGLNDAASLNFGPELSLSCVDHSIGLSLFDQLLISANLGQKLAGFNHEVAFFGGGSQGFLDFVDLGVHILR